MSATFVRKKKHNVKTKGQDCQRKVEMLAECMTVVAFAFY